MQSLRYTLCAVVLVGLLAVPATYTNPAAPVHAQLGSTAEIEFLPNCEFDAIFLPPDIEILGDTIECGYMYTPENPTDPSSLQLSIAFVVLRAADGVGTPDPIIYLEGGPGGSGILGVDYWVESPLRQNRDIILIDQRGTGYSRPTMSCYAFIPDYDGFEDMDDCASSVTNQGVDLGNYNTINNAYDVSQLMEALQPFYGYTNYNLLGISYGTRLGLAVMRDHPELVRTAILDSVYPQGLDSNAEQPLNIDYVLDQLFAECASDAACNAAYPDLEAIFYEVVYDLEEEPLLYDDGYEYYGWDFINELYDALSTTDVVPVIPAVIYLYYEGEYDRADELLYDGPPVDVSPVSDFTTEDYYDEYDSDDVDDYFDVFDTYGDAEAMFMAIECQEEIIFADIDLAYEIVEANNIDPDLADSQLINFEFNEEDCEPWLDTIAPPIANQPIFSDIPTLLVSGQFDTLTPPSWADYADATLDNAYNYVFPGFSHGVTDGNECIVSIYQQFLTNPSTEPDASCISRMDTTFYIDPAFQ